MGLTKTIAISGKPGLFSIINQSKGGFLVQSLVDQKKFPVTQSQNISVLNDIAIYTYDEDMPLQEVFVAIYEKTAGKEALSHKDSSKNLTAFFLEVIPNYDDERVYVSNIKKVIQWFNLLIKIGMDFSKIEKTSEKNTEEV